MREARISMMIKRLISRLKNHIYISCAGYWSESTTDHPREFDCEADYAGEITYKQCLINGGKYNPWTGKKDYIRYFLIYLPMEKERIKYLSKQLDKENGGLK